MLIPITIPVSVSASRVTFPVSVSASEVSVPVSVSAEYHMVDAEYYQGEYNFTPGDNEQIILTQNLLLSENIIINPIPSNYGRISYNGSILTVT